MLTQEIFKERVEALWNSQKRMAAPKKWKSGKRAGAVRNSGHQILFTKTDLTRWLWGGVGLNAIPCPYCRVPIDILSLTIDHVIPRSAGGEFRLENMQCICQDCNERKSNFSHNGFEDLLEFARTKLSPYDQGVLLGRLKAAHHGAAQRFFSKPAEPGQKNLPPPPKQNAMDFELGAF